MHSATNPSTRIRSNCFVINYYAKMRFQSICWISKLLFTDFKVVTLKFERINIKKIKQSIQFIKHALLTDQL